MQYVVLFLAGMFFVNFCPHFIMGVTGCRFRTPFVRDRNSADELQRTSSAVGNIVWALVNALAGLVLVVLAHQIGQTNYGIIAIGLGFALGGLGLAKIFSSGGSK